MFMIKKRIYYSSKRKKPAYSFIVRCVDFFVDIISLISKSRNRKVSKSSLDNNNFLIVSFGHLGDAQILSYTLPIIKKQFPEAQIDILIGEWCLPIFKQNPFVNNIIILNHFFTNRKNISLINKLFIHIKTSYYAYKKISKTGYSYSIDIRYTTATSHYLTGISPIKKTIGYGSAGFGGLLDKEIKLPDTHLHLIEIIGNLLIEADIKFSLKDISPYLSIPTDFEKTQSKFPAINLVSPKGYIVIFPETGEPLRALTPNFWIDLINTIDDHSSYNIIICGQNDSTNEWAKSIIGKKNIVVKTRDLLIEDLIELSKNAVMAFTLESFPAHLCSIFTKTISFFKDGAGYTYFPIAKFPSIIIHNDERSIERNHLPNLTTIYRSEIESPATFEIIATLLKKNDY